MSGGSKWQDHALELSKNTDMSWRQIAVEVGKPKSTVSDFLRMRKEQDWEVSGPKLLTYDIETSPIIAYIWSLYQNGVGLDNVVQDWNILSYAAKWYNEDDVIYDEVDWKSGRMHDDAHLTEGLWKLFDEADFLIGQNSRKFDTKKVQARMILNGIDRPPSTFRQIDILDIAKEKFAFTSRKLAYMTDKLCRTYKKKAHEEFPGMSLWVQCLEGNPRAWEVMQEYNKYDILSTEEVFTIFIPWYNKLPNFDLYHDQAFDNKDWIEDGYHYTNLGKYQKYRNVLTGQQRRGRINLLSDEKRKSILANII